MQHLHRYSADILVYNSQMIGKKILIPENCFLSIMSYPVFNRFFPQFGNKSSIRQIQLCLDNILTFNLLNDINVILISFDLILRHQDIKGPQGA